MVVHWTGATLAIDLNPITPHRGILWRPARWAVIAVVLILVIGACSNPAAPKDCVDAAEAAGAPEPVLDFLNNPTGDLGQAEKFVIRQFLNRSQLNDVCGDALDHLE